MLPSSSVLIELVQVCIIFLVDVTCYVTSSLHLGYMRVLLTWAYIFVWGVIPGGPILMSGFYLDNWQVPLGTPLIQIKDVYYMN